MCNKANSLHPLFPRDDGVKDEENKRDFMNGYLYILECADGSYYTGSTRNIEKRFYQRQNGEGANHTKDRLLVKLVYVEEFERIDEAFWIC